MHHRERFGLFPFRFAGFTRWRRREVQFSLDVLPLVAPEIHVLLAAPSRSGLRPPFPAQPICCSTFRIGVPRYLLRRNNLSGRRWRSGFPRCWPPSAAQTVHAVFPHTAFTKTHASEMQSKVLTEPGSQARTHRTAWFPEVVSSRSEE